MKRFYLSLFIIVIISMSISLFFLLHQQQKSVTFAVSQNTQSQEQMYPEDVSKQIDETKVDFNMIDDLQNNVDKALQHSTESPAE